MNQRTLLLFGAGFDVVAAIGCAVWGYFGGGDLAWIAACALGISGLALWAWIQFGASRTDRKDAGET